MPIYDFKCNECGQVSEVFLRSPDQQAVACPKCGGQDMEKLISASYMIRMGASTPSATCCGKTERCAAPPCSDGDGCRRG